MGLCQACVHDSQGDMLVEHHGWVIEFHIKQNKGFDLLDKYLCDYFDTSDSIWLHILCVQQSNWISIVLE